MSFEHAISAPDAVGPVKTPGLFSFSGRIARKTFFKIEIGCIASVCFVWFCGLIYFSLGASIHETVDAAGNMLPEYHTALLLQSVFSGLLSLPILYVAWMAAVKRYHDIGRSGWWLLLLFVPVIGQIAFWWFLWDLCLDKGMTGPNRYGPDPRGVVSATASLSKDFAGPGTDEVLIPAKSPIKAFVIPAVLCISLSVWQHSIVKGEGVSTDNLGVAIAFALNVFFGVFSLSALVAWFLNRKKRLGLRLNDDGFEWTKAGPGKIAFTPWKDVERIESKSLGELRVYLRGRPSYASIFTGMLNARQEEVIALMEDRFARATQSAEAMPSDPPLSAPAPEAPDEA